MNKILGFAFCVSLLGVGCSSGEESSSSDLEDLKPGSISDLNVVDGNNVEINFQMKSDKCYGYKTNVIENDDQVEIGLEIGNRKGVDPKDCDESLKDYKSNVKLKKDLGDRPIKVISPDDEAS